MRIGRAEVSRAIAALVVTLVLTGCGIGYNRTLFFTTSNIGLNIDSAPPTAELSISRRENVIGPSLEGGVKLPVLASFESRFTGLLGVMADVSSTFAGGDAAETLATLYDSATGSPTDSTRCVSKAPEATLFDLDVSPPRPGEVKPFIFGTDTSFGLKVRWSGATAQYPDSVKLGYNRKEWALAPVFARPASSVAGTITTTEVTADGTQVVKLANGWIYVMTPRTVVLRAGQPVPFSALSVGDAVEMYATHLVEKKGTVYVRAPVSPGLRNAPCSVGEWEVSMPSFLAALDHNVNLTTPNASGDDHLQLFATGAAATSLATQPAVRAAMLRRIDPKAADEKLNRFSDHQQKQIAAVKDVQKQFAAADPATKTKILNKAKTLGLVQDATTEQTFSGDLSDTVNGNNTVKTDALEALRTFARNPQ